MQFLESKAASDDGKGKKSPKSNGSKKQQQQAQQQRRRSPPPPVSSNNTSLAAPVALHGPYNTPPMNPEDQPFFPSPSPPAASPPPFSAYQQSYSPPSDNGFYSASSHHQHQHHPVTTWMGSGASLTATTGAPTLPPMTHFSEASYNTKGNESMSFATYGDYSLGVPATASPYDSNPHVSTHHHDHYQHHLSAPRTSSALLPPLTASPTSPAAIGHLAAPDLYRSRYPPPLAPTRL